MDGTIVIRTPSRAALLALALCLALLAAAPAAAFGAQGMLVGIEQDGVMDQAGVRSETLDRMQGLGAKVLRFQLRWDQVAAKCNPASGGAPASSPANACYDWSLPDAVVREATTRGIRVIFTIDGTPRWLFQKDFGYTGTTAKQFDQFVKYYADFAAATATHYAGGDGVPRVDYFTIWNEPNGDYFWNPRRVSNSPVAAIRYASLVNVAARRIKAVDPQLYVAAGPLSPTSSLKPGTFLDQALPRIDKLKAPIDAWAHNGYTRTEHPLASTMRLPEIGLGNIDDLTAKLDRYATTRNLPVWITEYSVETAPDEPSGVSVDDQSAILGEASYVAWKNPRIGMFIWYAMWDDGSAAAPADGFQTGLFHRLDTCGQRWCPKASAGMMLHPLWLSATTVQRGQAITIWGQGRASTSQAKVYYWLGTRWQAFDNVPAADGSLYLTWAPPSDAWLVTCDVTCGPVQKVTVT
jgi:hypothetical protein